jgi:hypothetical protein
MTDTQIAFMSENGMKPILSYFVQNINVLIDLKIFI